MLKDYYSILKVSQNSSQKEVKRSYRKLALETHPDKNKSHDAHNLFIDVSEAYQILGHVERRKVYDSLLEEQQSRLTITAIRNHEDYRRYTDWTAQAREEGKRQTKLNYPQFLEQLKKSLGETVATSINFLSVIIGLGLGGTGIYGLINTTYSLYTGEYKFGFGLLLLYPIFIIFSVLGVFQIQDLFKNTSSD